MTLQGFSRKTQLSGNIMLAALAGMMLFACENSLTVVKEVTASDTLAAVTAHDVVYWRSDSGSVFMKLQAPQMYRVEGNEPTIEFPKGFIAFFFDSLEHNTSQIKAKYGISNENTRIMTARDSVIVENFVTQEKLESETLFWNQQTKKIVSPGLVKVTSPGRVVFGDSLIAAEDFSSRTIYNIRATIEVDESDDY